MRKVFYLLLFFYTWFPVDISAQDKPEYAVSLIPEALVKGSDAVIRKEITQLKIESPRKNTYSTTQVVTILDEDSPRTYVNVVYDKYSKAHIDYINLYDAQGKFIRRIKKSELTDQAAFDGVSLLNDTRVIFLKSFGGKLPYTIEFTWKQEFHETMFYPAWSPVNFGEAVEEASFIMHKPADLVIHTRTLNFPFIYKKEIIDGQSVETWTILKHKVDEKEADGPPDHEIIPVVFLSPAYFEVETFSGSMSDWKSFGRFLYELNKGREKITPEMTALVKKMTANLETAEEKIDVLYKWLQQNMRYVSIQLGIGGWQSFDAAYVEKNRFGDCKALSTFMKGMLHEAGVESWQVIIKADEEENLMMEDFVSLDFNHMMLHIPENNMWLECTSNYFPPGMIHEVEENKKVLLLTPDGGVIATTPVPETGVNKKITVDTILVSDQISVKGDRQYFGNLQNHIRGAYHNDAPDEQRQQFLEAFPLSVSKLNILQLGADDKGEKSSLRYDVTLSKFGSVSGTRYFLPVNAIHTLDNPCDENAQRDSDYISHERSSETNEIFIAIPSGYSMEHLPAKVVHEFQGMQFTQELKIENEYIRVIQEFIQSPLRLSPTEYEKLCAFYRSISEANGRMIVLKQSKA